MNPTTRFRYPGELGMPPVPVSFAAPEGWEATILAEDTTVLREPVVAEGSVGASITFARERLGALATLDGVAAGLLVDAADDKAEFSLIDERVTVLDELPAVWREQALMHEPGAEPVIQVILIALVPVAEGVMQDLILLVVTLPFGRRDEAVELAELVRTTTVIDA